MGTRFGSTVARYYQASITSSALPYAVQAEDEIAAIDLALEGQGLEIDSETRDAYIREFQSRDPRLPS